MTNRRTREETSDPMVPSERGKQVPPGGGEGDRVSDRRYRENAERFARSGKVEDAAEDAEDALQGEEAQELREAEERGRKGR